MKRNVVALLSAGALLSTAVASFAQDPTELLRADIRANKTAIVTSAMELDDTQSEAPVNRVKEHLNGTRDTVMAS